MTVRSLYVRIGLASLLTVMVSLAAFVVITSRVTDGPVARFTWAMSRHQLEQAIDAFNRGGTDELKGFLRTLDRELGGEHHLTDAAGWALATGADQRQLLSLLTSADRPFVASDGRFVAQLVSPDGRYRLIVASDPPFTTTSFAPLYLVVLGAIVLVSWLVAFGIVSPLRKVTAAADRFGQGDLSARVPYRGRNEIGTLAASFNQMADRIQTLLTAERRLLQDVSHELRSPLARLSFATELARTAPDRDGAIDRVQRDLDRLATLIGELLEMTRVEGDVASRKRDAVDINGVVAETVEACDIDATASGCRISLSGGVTKAVIGDRELLRRAVENVLRNALFHAPADTDVDVTLHEDATAVAVDIRDRGPGVADEALTRIFDAFYRVDTARTAGRGGLGLGLSIAQRAVHLHHGTIKASAATPGLRVTITIPAQDGASRP